MDDGKLDGTVDGMAQRPFSVDDFLQLEEPTIRVPMHLSPDGRWLALSVQRKRREVGLGGQDGYRPDGVPAEAGSSRVLVVDTGTGATVEPFPQESTSWGAQWSPDGRRLAAYVRHAGPPCLGIWDPETDAWTLLRQAPVRPFFGFEVPRWTPDGQQVVVKLARGTAPETEQRAEVPSTDEGVARVRVFTSDAGAPPAPQSSVWGAGTDLGVVHVATGTVRLLVENWTVRGWEIAPDGHGVAVMRYDDTTPPQQRSQFDLMLLSLEGGEPRTLARAVPHSYGISFSWSPDSERIAYVSQPSGRGNRIFVVPADGATPPVELSVGEDLRLRLAEYEAPRWSADGARVYCLANEGWWEFAPDGSSRRLIRMDLEGDDSAGRAGTGAQALGEDWSIKAWVQRPSAPVCWRATGGALLLVVMHAETKHTGLASVDPATGQAVLLAQWEKRPMLYWSFGAEASSDGTAVYLFLQGAEHPPEVWACTVAVQDGSDGGCLRAQRLLSLNPRLEDVALGNVRLVEWTALNGARLRGALFLPPRHADGEPVPLIVNVYGGSTHSDLLYLFGGNPATLAGQLLAARGYAVLYPDLPLDSRDPLRQLPGLVLPAVDRLVELGIADASRVGVMGHSYGGYCTLSLLVQTGRFRAAVATGAVVNLTSFYGVMGDNGDSPYVRWAETGQGRLGGSLWERRDAYVENSPLFYLDRVTTPVLLAAGTALPGETTQMAEAFSALRRLGKPVELRLYDGEGHMIDAWSEANFRDHSTRVLDWFDAHLQA